MCLEAVVSISQDYGDEAALSVSVVLVLPAVAEKKQKEKRKRKKRMTAAVREQAVKNK